MSPGSSEATTSTRMPVSAPPERTSATPTLSMREAVSRFVPDGQQVLIGGFAYSDPLAFAHELIRQGRRGLQVIKTSGGLLVDQLIGAGCVDSLLLCHVWNSVGPEPAHCFRRAVEHERPGPVRVEELSYGAMTMALLAGACDLPFMPTTPVQGAGHFTRRTFRPEKFGVVSSPFGGEDVVVVAPLAPELGVFHVQRVDTLGNAQVLGPTAELRYAIASCRRVIVIAEELVDTEVVRSRPELTVAPAFMVDAIVVEPWAAHPTDSYGDYRRDLDHHRLYGERSRTEEAFHAYVDEWILRTADHSEFVAKLGPERLAALRC
jgi:glutaconate CoA-transferase subunit A